jgi:protein-disulfide isomerase
MQKFWQENKVNIIGWLVILAVVGVGAVFAISSQNEQARIRTEELKVVAEDHAVGAETAPVTIVEYADFQCPGCATYRTIFSEVKAQRGDKIRFVFRHFPLRGLHRNAVAAAIAAEAASRQNKFWEMHDVLFIRQNEWAGLDDPTAKFIEYAAAVNLDVTKFSSDIQDKALLEIVQAHETSADRLGLDGTPSIFINGEPVQANVSADDIIKMIDAKAK